MLIENYEIQKFIEKYWGECGQKWVWLLWSQGEIDGTNFFAC